MINLSLPSPAKVVPPSFQSPRRNTSSSSNQSLKIADFEPFKDRLIRLANVGRLHQAMSTIDLMAQRGLAPDLLAYSVLLKSCIRTRQFDLGKKLHAKLSASGLVLDSVVLNSLISLYSKCGDWVMASAIFQGMGDHRDLVSWSAMISCFAHNGMEMRAVAAFWDMVECREYPNQFCFSAVIQACSNAENAWIGMVMFGFVIKSGYFESDACVGCALIDLFAKGSGKLNCAREVFDRMPEKNSVAWTLMITRYSQLGRPRDAIELFVDMVASGYVPDRFTFSSVVSTCAELELLSLGQQLHSQVVKYGLALDVCVGCSLVDMYAKCAADGSMVHSRKVFDLLPKRNVMSWTALITGYVQSGWNYKEAIDLYCGMVEDQVLPNHFTFSSLLKACANLSDPAAGEQIYAHAVKLGLASVNCVGNSLISLYSRTGRMEDARKAFDILVDKNLVSYNTIFNEYAKGLDSNEALELFNRVEDIGVGADAFTFASLLSGAASIGAAEKGEQIHARLLKMGLGSNQCISNALISMYSRCGNIEAASQVFAKMEDRNVISWTSIITGLAKHGFAALGLEIFQEMLVAGIKPNEVTYVAVLSACSHVGMINEG